MMARPAAMPPTGPAPLPAPAATTPAPHDGVSFVVPVYNKADVLPPVLEAIAAQTGDFPREYIFIDDGSTDASADVLRALTADWPNVRTLSQPNRGSAAATNAGLAAARMPFVKCVDADDLLTRDATRLLLDALLADPSAVLAYGDRMFFAPGAQPDLSTTGGGAITRCDAPLLPALRNALFNPTQFLTRTHLARAVGGCDERVVFSQEYSLTLRLARHGAFVHLHQTLAHLLDDPVNRLSNDQARQLQRVTRAVGLFVADYPDLPNTAVRFACRRNANRAWHFARRRRQAHIGSRWFWHAVRGRLGLWRDAAGFIAACEAVYDR